VWSLPQPCERFLQARWIPYFPLLRDLDHEFALSTYLAADADCVRTLDATGACGQYNAEIAEVGQWSLQQHLN
jgi:hypothetical protein